MNAAESFYSLTARHLAPDLKSAGAGHPELKLDGLTSKKLRGHLEALARLAPKVAYPAAPELRIISAQGTFVVKVSGGRLEFVSWSASTRASGALTAQQIHAAITGEGLDETPARGPAESPHEKAARKRTVLVSALLVFAIVAVNSFTVWLFVKPKRTLLPKDYTVLTAEPAERVIASAAGIYETGGAAGDRQLRIGPGGEVEWIKFGPDRKVADRKTFTVRAAKIGEKTALLTAPRQAMIEIRDLSVLVLYGDTYRRIQAAKK